MLYEEWSLLNIQEKEDKLRSLLQTLPISFELKEMKCFQQNGVSLETGILLHNSEEFVFIPGKKEVTLGWNVETCSPDKNVKKAFEQYWEKGKEYYSFMIEDINAYYEEELEKAKKLGDIEKISSLEREKIEDLEEPQKVLRETLEDFMKELKIHIRSCTSPIRTVTIPSMIAARDMKYISSDISYEGFLKELKQTPFSIPTEDEWEYLCGGGTRTFFRWGDSLEKELENMFDLGTTSKYQEEKEEFLAIPNMFGLYIAYNSYQYELVNSSCMTKGGDGGCSLCGGDGIIYVAPCFSTFYRNQNQRIYYKLSKNFYCYRKVLHL